MSLSPGARIGVYDITAQIGEGGMGKVYRARDTKLNRDVALKVLLADVANDPERLARFQREAQVLASLNHPHIGAIHGLEESGGITALVMELVDGEDLSQRIARGAIPIDEALQIARQIAEALEAAHEQGIIHRDLKPANIKVRRDGTVKVLDFGLAKAVEQRSGTRDQGPGNAVLNSPTITSPAMTQAGMILGTAAYMSPEQARGRPVDRRADIWAFGCVLFEMVSGVKPFDGEDVTEILGAIVKTEPEWSRVPATTPAYVTALLRRCLEKDVRKRLPHIGVARQDLEAPAPAIGPSTPRRHAASPVLWVATGFMTAALGFAWLPRETPATSAAAMVSSIELPAHLTRLAGQSFAISPDGTRIAFVAPDAAGRDVVWVRSLASDEAQPLNGTEFANGPFWSPDSRHIAFAAQGRLKRIDASGGTPITLAENAGGSSGAWSDDDVILYTSTAPRQIMRVSAKGGAATTTHAELYFPSFLPGGKRFLYLRARNLYVRPTAGGAEQLLLEHAGTAVVASGHLIFARESTLFAQPIDVERLSLSGEPFPLAENLEINTGSGAAAFAVSNTGVLVYQTIRSPMSRLVWIDQEGRQTAIPGEPARYSEFSLSPDGSRVAAAIWNDATERDIWLIDARRGVRTRLTSGPDDDSDPVISPDGASIVHHSRRIATKALVVRSLDARSLSRVVEDGFNKYPHQWSADGRWLLYSTMSVATALDLWVAPAATGQKPSAVMQSAASEMLGEWSPSGGLLAYQSNESGSTEVYVTRYPRGGERWRVSAAGGTNPHWSRNGQELLFLGNTSLMRVSVRDTGKSVELDNAAAVVEQPYRMQVARNLSSNVYSVSPDGQRFLFGVPLDDSPTPLKLVVNWPQRLRR
jgi:Tol biopolymer transport system component/tRNA A-37 threonylcarbamoyl transferase component Bud32